MQRHLPIRYLPGNLKHADYLYDPLCLRAVEEHRCIRDLIKAISIVSAWEAEYYSGLADLVRDACQV